DGGVDRDLSPAEYGVAHPDDLGLGDAAAAFLRVEVVARQEDLRHGELLRAGIDALALDMRLEEILRDADVDAGAVTRLAVGIDGAAMPQRFQRGDAGLDDGAARLSVDR